MTNIGNEEHLGGTTLQEFAVDDRVFKVLNDASDTLIAGGLIADKTWEPWQLELYKRIIQRDSICLDIGANIGTSALAMSCLAVDGHVYSFEPVNHTFSMLERNVRNNMVNNITPVNIGISDRAGEATMVINRSVLGASHQISKEETRRIRSGLNEYTQSFKTTNLDAWVDEYNIGTPRLIKVDVEGFEVEVIQGGQKTFFGSRDTIAIVEFAVTAQRNASDRFPARQKDIELLRILTERYQHVYLIRRDASLVRIHNYAELRTLMLGGYQVDDLLCCNNIPPGLEDLVMDFSKRSLRADSAVIADGSSLYLIENRFLDGWSGVAPFDARGSQAVVQACVQKDQAVVISFDTVLSAHANRITHLVLVAVNNNIQYVEIIDRIASVTASLSSGVNTIFLEAESTLPAFYLGNPNDTRSIGFRFALPEIERRVCE